MKITIEEKKEQVQSEIRLQDLKLGTVINFGDSRRPCGLIVEDSKTGRKEIVLLTHGGGGDWLIIANGFRDSSIKNVLGKLTEIIVEPI